VIRPPEGVVWAESVAADLGPDGVAELPAPPVRVRVAVPAGDRIVAFGAVEGERDGKPDEVRDEVRDEVWVLDLWTARWRKGASPPFSAPVFKNIDERSVTWTGEELIVPGPVCARFTSDDEVNVCTSGDGAVEVAAYRPERDVWRVLRAPEGLRASWMERGTMVDLFSRGWTGREVVYDPYPSAEPWDQPRRLLLLDPTGEGSWRWTDPFPKLGLGSDEQLGWEAVCVGDGQVVAATEGRASGQELPAEARAARLDVRGRWEVFATFTPEVDVGAEVRIIEVFCLEGGSPIMTSVGRRHFVPDHVGVWVLDVPDRRWVPLPLPPDPVWPAGFGQIGDRLTFSRVEGDPHLAVLGADGRWVRTPLPLPPVAADPWAGLARPPGVPLPEGTVLVGWYRWAKPKPAPVILFDLDRWLTAHGITLP
jgi:hypothetical protein